MNVWTLLGRVSIDASEAKRGLKDSERAAQDAGRGMERAVDDSVSKSVRRLNDLGAAMQKLGAQWSARVTAPIAALGGVILKTAADFERSMNRVGALTMATGDQMDRLSGLARQLGATTAFSASQAADAMGFLAMAGFEVEQIYDALPGVLQLASAGQLELAEAADIASNVLTGFGLQASELGRVNDVLAKASASANTNVRQLGEAFSYAGPVAAGLGISIEEAGAAMGMLSNAGIQASSAGTGLRQILSTLVLKSAELGVTVRDTRGEMLPLADILAQLEDRTFSAEEAMALFGQRGGPAVIAMLGQGSEALRAFTTELEDAGGTAERLAGAQMRGLHGALATLRSAIEAVGLAIAESGLLAWATAMVERLAAFFSRLSETNPAILRMGVVIAGLLAVIGPLLVAAGTLVRTIAAMRAGFIALRAAVVPMAWPIAVVAVALLALWQAWEHNFLGIRDITARAVTFLRTQFERLVAFGRSVIQNWETIAWGWREIQEALGYIAQAAGDAVAAAWETSTLAVQRAFTAMFRFVERGLQTMTSGIIDGINALIRSINRVIGTEIAEIAQVAMTAWADIDDTTAARLQAAQDRVSAAHAAMAAEMRYIRDTVAAVVDVIAGGMQRAEESVDAVTEAAALAGMTVEDLLRMIDEDGPGAAAVFEAIAAAATDLAEEATDATEDVEELTDALTRTVEAHRQWTDSLRQARFGELAAAHAEALAARRSADQAITAEAAAYRDLIDAIEAAAAARAVDAEMRDRLATAEFNREVRAEAEAQQELLAAVERMAAWREREAEAARLALRAAREERRERMRATEALNRTVDAHRQWTDSLREAATLRDQENDRIAAEAAAIADLLNAIDDVAAARAADQAFKDTLAARADADAAIRREIQAQEDLLAAIDAVAAARTRDAQQAADTRAARERARAERIARDAARRRVAMQAEYDESRRAAAAPGEAPTPPATTPSTPASAIATVIGGLQALGATLVAEVPLIGTAFKAISSGAGPMGAFVAVLAEMVTGSEAFQGLMKRVTETLAPIIERIVTPLAHAFEALLEALWPVIEVALALVETALKPIAWVLTTLVAPVFTFVARLIAGIWNTLARILNWIPGVNLPLIDIDGGLKPDPTPEPAPEPSPGPTPGIDAGPTPAPQTFGGTPQAIQLAIATPLVEAAHMMLEAAERFDATLTSLLPTQGGGPDLGALPPFTSAIDRLTPVLERLLAEGVRIDSNGGSVPRGSRTAYLRGI